MRNTLLTFLALLFVAGCNTAKSPNKSTHNNAYFKIQIEQEGRIISPFKNAVFLNKKPFKFNIEMKGVDGIYLSTTWDDKMYNFPKNKNIFFCDDEGKYEDCGFLSPQTMASENYNSDKSLTVTNKDYQHYWFYSDEYNWHRLDKGVEVKNGVIFASYTVENIFDILLKDKKNSKLKAEYPISEIDKDIYVVVAAEIEGKNEKSHKELQREKFILKFK